MAGTGGGADAAREAAGGGGSSVGGGSQGGGGGGRRQNFSSAYTGGLNPGVRTAVVPGFGYTNRKNQSLGDIQEQVDIANAKAAGRNGSGNTGGSGGGLVWKNPIAKKAPVNPKRIYARPAVTTPPTETVPEEEQPGFGIGDPLQDAYSDAYVGQPGVGMMPGQTLGGIITGDYGTGYGPHSPVNTGAKGDYQGGGVKVGGRALGGPVGPGQYTVGENGPETLRLGPGSGGAVIPNNMGDRARGMMDPARRQAMVSALQGRFGGGGITGMGGGMPRPAPATPPPRPMTPPPPAPRPMAPAPRPTSGWQG